MRRTVWSTAWALPLWLGPLCLGQFGCGGVTPDQRVELRTQVTSSSERSFRNAFGWTVHVDGAWMSISALALLEGESLGASSVPRAPERRWQDFFIGTAHAHPGHYQEGNVVAEMLTPTSVNLTTTTELVPSQAVTGQARSGKVIFGSPPQGAYAARLEDSVIRVTGRAQPAESEPADAESAEDGEESAVVYFDATARQRDLSPSDAPIEVPGCPFQGGKPASGGTLELDVDWTLWFDQVDFGDLAQGSETNPSPLSLDTRADGGFLRGVVKAAAYRFRLIEDSQ